MSRRRPARLLELSGEASLTRRALRFAHARGPLRTSPLEQLKHRVAVGSLISFVLCAPVEAARMLVLQAGDTPRLATVVSTLRERVGMTVDVVQLADLTEEGWQSALVHGEKPSVIVALGPRASDFVFVRRIAAPTVHCLAGPDALRAGVPALPSDVPADLQASWLRRLVPNAKVIGFAFDPLVNARRVEAIAAGFGAAGYRTFMSPVTTPAALPQALNEIAARADVLFALPDATVYTRESARGLLLQSFRTRTPLIGPNDAWVRMGALYSLDWDYVEVGAACAALALREVQPSRGAPPPLPPPLRPRVSVNTKSASQFDLRWPAELLRAVDRRHE
ncbi:MAG TPA: ABC transporter substrate binding protein [Casimicrobiaceae bacterium]|nr:ABC transporter substrate binding protein [Casimicrobiaceae bacterium]